MLDMWKRPSKLSVFWKSILFGICLDKWQNWFCSEQSSHKVDVAMFAKVVFIFHCGFFYTFAGKLWRWAQRSRRWTRWSWRWKLQSKDPGFHRPTPGALQNPGHFLFCTILHQSRPFLFTHRCMLDGLYEVKGWIVNLTTWSKDRNFPAPGTRRRRGLGSRSSSALGSPSQLGSSAGLSVSRDNPPVDWAWHWTEHSHHKLAHYL